MPEAYIIDAVRSPVGRRNGGLAQIHPADLGAHAIGALMQQVDVDPAAVDATGRNAAANRVVLDVRELDAERVALPSADVAVANISLARVESVLVRVGSPIVIASGYLEQDEPKLDRYRRRERRVRDGWAADVLERAQ